MIKPISVAWTVAPNRMPQRAMIYQSEDDTIIINLIIEINFTSVPFVNEQMMPKKMNAFF